MTLATKTPTESTYLTYEDYMAEPETMARYDILDGERIFMTQPSDQHQDIVLSIGELLRGYQRRTKTSRVKIAPCDVLITRVPLRVRQPDVMLISQERYAGRTPEDTFPFDPAPELVVEVVSPSETPGIRAGKIRDYCSVDVRECWLVRPDAETVEVLRLTPAGPERAAFYGAGQTLQSLTFRDLTVVVDDIFQIEE